MGIKYLVWCVGIRYLVVVCGYYLFGVVSALVVWCGDTRCVGISYLVVWVLGIWCGVGLWYLVWCVRIKYLVVVFGY